LWQTDAIGLSLHISCMAFSWAADVLWSVTASNSVKHRPRCGSLKLWQLHHHFAAPSLLLPPRVAQVTYNHERNFVLSIIMALRYLLLPCTDSIEIVSSSHCMRCFTSVSLTLVALNCCMPLLNTQSNSYWLLWRTPQHLFAGRITLETFHRFLAVSMGWLIRENLEANLSDEVDKYKERGVHILSIPKHRSCDNTNQDRGWIVHIPKKPYTL
jgi:hypothetical protein